MRLLRMTATSLLLLVGVQGFALDFYLGPDCQGEAEGSATIYGNQTTCSASTTQAESVLIFNNAASDEQYEVVFYGQAGCGDVVVGGAATPGCVTFDGDVLSFGIVGPINNKKRDVHTYPGKFMHGVQTVKHILASHNYTVEEEDDFDENWHMYGLGRWIGVPPGRNRFEFAQELYELGFRQRPFTDADILNERVLTPDERERYELGLARGRARASGNLTELEVRDDWDNTACYRGFVCALVLTATVQTTYEQFISVYDGITTSRLWGLLNAGLVAHAINNWYFTGTSNPVIADACDKTDRQCLEDALAQNFGQNGNTNVDTRNEKVTNYEQGVSGNSEWRASSTQPRYPSSFVC